MFIIFHFHQVGRHEKTLINDTNKAKFGRANSAVGYEISIHLLVSHKIQDLILLLFCLYNARYGVTILRIKKRIKIQCSSVAIVFICFPG